MDGELFDLLVIGGGINGTGVAADAAGRGLSVLLAEMDDLGGGTSSASSKLIHGGLRYLETWEFRLVREALAEREILLERAPHIIWPMRFVLPHGPGMRPRLMVRAGLFLYDHLAKRRRIPASASLDLARDSAGAVLRSEFRAGFAYWDCWVDDARLVVLNARLAADKGARIMTRTRVASLERGPDGWTATLEAAGSRKTCHARVVVNAGGPWADRVAALTRRNSATTAAPRLRLVKGSHIVVPRIAGANDGFLLQNPDGRVVFVLPFEGDFTLIGTTDVPFQGDPADVTCSFDEETYLIEAANRFLARPLHTSQIVWRFAGVRPLQGSEDERNPSAVSRDYQLEVDRVDQSATILSIIGGKVTTYRRLAEAVMEQLRPDFPAMPPAWTAGRPLPGGDIPDADFQLLLETLAGLYPGIPEANRLLLARRHGSLTDEILGDAKSLADLGADLGAGLTEREVRYFAEHEWARTATDVLWRRTKAGLHFTSDADREAAARRIEALL